LNIFIIKIMNEPFLLSNLIELQEIDNEIYEIENQKSQSDDVVLLKELEKKFKEANKDKEEAKKHLSEYFAQIEDSELDMKNIKQKIDNIEVKLNDQSLDPNELVNYTKQKESSEQQLIKIQQNVDLLKNENNEELNEIKKYEDVIDDIKKNLFEVSKRVQTEWKDLDIKLSQSESKKTAMILSFPDEFKKLYDDLKARGVDVIAAYKLNNNQCGCCGVDLTSSELDKILKSKFQQCPYCEGVVV
tara:strand:+ start:289 stop:1023 length:735 start_codon:yes stop_codon:yes gene_type:complete